MFPRGQHPIYSHTSEDRQEILKSMNFNEKQVDEYVDIVTDWFYKQPHLPDFGIKRNMVEVYMIATKGSVEKAKQGFDAFYRHRLNSPEFIKDRIELLNSGRSIWNSHIFAPVSKLFNGRRITMVKVTDPDIRFKDVFLSFFTVTDIRSCNDFFVGDSWIIDIEKMSLSHMLKLDFHHLYKGNKIFQEAIGIRIFDIHIINCSVAELAEKLLMIVKPFLSKKIYDRIKIHSSVEDLHKYFPREYLSKDYGGELPTIEEFKDKMEGLITSAETKEFLIEACNAVSDESKRPTEDQNGDVLAGTFRKLAID